MTKFKFIKPFSSRVTVGGAVGMGVKSWKIGDVVEGSVKGNSIEIRIAPHSVFNDKPSNMSYQEMLLVPSEFLKEYSGKEDVNLKKEINNSNMGDPNKKLFSTQNIIIGILVIGGIFGILKWKKII